MNLAINDNISNKELIDRIISRDISEYDLMKEFHISDSALRKYKKNTSQKQIRKSDPRMKLIVLDYTLGLAEEGGLDNPFEFIKNIFVKGVPLLEFINEHAREGLVVIVIEEVLKSQIKQKVGMSPLETYREKYSYLNDETLEVASVNDPGLLKELIEDNELRPSTRGDIIEALSVGGRSEYFDYIKDKIAETAPHIREAAFNGLYEYFDSSSEFSFLEDLFKEKLEIEKADGVKATISSLLEEMKAA